MTAWTPISPVGASWALNLVDRNILTELGGDLLTEFLVTGISTTTTTWSATALNGNIVLSNGNLTASGGGSVNVYEPGRAIDAAVIGSGAKIYWEVHLDTLTGNIGESAVGVANSSNTFGNGQYLGIQANGLGYFDDGTVIRNNATLTTLAVPVASNTICVACSGHSKIWFRINGGNWNNDVIANQNPATATGGIDISAMGDLIPAYSVRLDIAASKMTANFGATALSFAVPAGFSTFDTIPIVSVAGPPLICETQGNPSQAVWTPVSPATGFH